MSGWESLDSKSITPAKRERERERERERPAGHRLFEDIYLPTLPKLTLFLNVFKLAFINEILS